MLQYWKRRQLAGLLCLLCAVVLLFSCAPDQAEKPEESGAYRLYFRQADLTASAGGDSLETESIHLKEGLTLQEQAEVLLESLLTGPSSELLSSALPAGTVLLSVKVENGQALVDFSRPYGTLSGVRLTLADYAVTLTLSQLPGIALVRITVQGQDLAYRDKQIFSARDVLLSSEEDVVGTVDAVLYFLDQSGVLTEEPRTLDLYEGDTQAMAIIRALENAPEGYISPLPEGFRIKTVWLEEDICYVNVPSALFPEGVPSEQALEALRQSLQSLEAVEDVCFLVDGELSSQYRQGALETASPRE